MRRRETPMEVALKGAAAGLVGTAVLTAALETTRLVGSPVAAAGSDEPAAAAEATIPPARLVGQVASAVFSHELPRELQRSLGHGAYWGYGMLWGAVYGISQASIRLPVLLHGIILGLIVWLVAPVGFVPAVRPTEEPAQRPGRLRLRSLLFHQLYGCSVALVFGRLWRAD